MCCDNLRKLRILFSVYLVILLTTNPIFAEPNQSGELSVIYFNSEEENTESPLLSITGFGFNEKICAADSRWPVMESNLPMPLNSSQMNIKSLDNERNLTIFVTLHLISKDSDIENWTSRSEFWEGGTNDLYAKTNDEKKESEQVGAYLKFEKSNSSTFTTKFMIIWPNEENYEKHWDGDWPEREGIYSAILRLGVEKTDTQGNWIPDDDYLQTLEYGMGDVEVISQGDNCFLPQYEESSFFEMIYACSCCLSLLYLFALFTNPKDTVFLTSLVIGKIRSKPVIEIQEPGKTKRNRSRHISNKVRSQVWARDNGQCVYCNSSEDLQFDHIIPFSKGGSNAAENLQILCKICNQNKSDKI